METAAQIKLDLINQINATNNINLLKALKSIFNSLEQEPYQLSIEQKKAIREGKEDIKQGNFIEHEKLMIEMKEWLSKK